MWIKSAFMCATTWVRFWDPSVSCVFCLLGSWVPQYFKCKIPESLIFPQRIRPQNHNSHRKKKKKKAALLFKIRLQWLSVPFTRGLLPNWSLLHLHKLDPIAYVSPPTNSPLFLSPVPLRPSVFVWPHKYHVTPSPYMQGIHKWMRDGECFFIKASWHGQAYPSCVGLLWGDPMWPPKRELGMLIMIGIPCLSSHPNHFLFCSKKHPWCL